MRIVRHPLFTIFDLRFTYINIEGKDLQKTVVLPGERKHCMNLRRFSPGKSHFTSHSPLHYSHSNMSRNKGPSGLSFVHALAHYTITHLPARENGNSCLHSYSLLCGQEHGSELRVLPPRIDPDIKSLEEKPFQKSWYFLITRIWNEIGRNDDA